MPPLKQPTSLEKMAMDVLVEYFVQFFRMCTFKGSSDKFREGVAFIKNEIRPRMPGTFAVELYNEVLQEYVQRTRDEAGRVFFEHLRPYYISPQRRHVRIASELLFDDDITGVKCSSVIMYSLELKDLIRIRGIIDLESLRKIPYSLEMLHLKHLTVFKYRYCTDSDLSTLSEHCEKLEHVNVSRSDEVTDAGLHSLASCNNLRYLSVSHCSNVSLGGLIRFLSINKTIRDLFTWFCDDVPGFEYRQIRNWDSDPTVYSSIESFTIVEDSSDRHLRSIVAKFPNLRSIKVYECIMGNLSVLKSLSELSKIDFYSETIAGWTQFKSLLECVGPQIHHLILYHHNINDTQRALNSIFRLCENLESLHFECNYKFGTGKLVVPPFEKLRYLKFTSPPSSRYDSDDEPDEDLDENVIVSTLELGQMLLLENLQVDGFVIGESLRESMIIDHTNFPNLKEMALTEFRYNTSITNFKRLEQVVKTNNLNLKLGKLKYTRC